MFYVDKRERMIVFVVELNRDEPSAGKATAVSASPRLSGLISLS